MLKDSYDKLLCLFLIVALAALVNVLFRHQSTPGSTPVLEKALERQMAKQARADLLSKLYLPVEALTLAGDLQPALLKLNELNRTYPNEPHGHILKAEILSRMGALDEAVASYVEGVRVNGEYLDSKGPLSRRLEIQRIAEEGLKVIGSRSRANPGNASLEASLRNVNYLRSRLAGGCE